MRSRLVLDPSAGLELPLRGLLAADADRCAAVAADDGVPLPGCFKLELLCGSESFEPTDFDARLFVDSYLSCNVGI